MKFLKIRVLPLFLVFVLSASLLVVPAFAADFPGEFRDHDAVADWNSKLLTSNSMGLNALSQATGFGATANEIFWGLVDAQVSNKAGEVNRSELEILASTYTAFFTSTIGSTFGEQIKNSFGDVFNDILARTLIGNWDPYFEVHQHPSSGLYRIKEMTTGLFVVDSAGRYPYAEESSDGYLGSDQWVPISAMDGGSFRMLSKEAIYNLADDVGGMAYTRGNYICIAKNASSGVVDKMVLANEDGKPYVCWKDKNQSATEQERPTTNVTENGNIVEGDDNSINLDLEGMTMLLPGGTLAFIDQIIYDESTKSYHIDSHDTYKTENNYYITNTYTWNYYINYTSITYIGQTEEYNKYYEVYYELPDGRSSADLTKEDLEQLNLSVDVIPYGRSADDVSLRSLYHFDGDTKDSSYWNYCTNFKWVSGASLTYMDAGVFDGALYLDEGSHDFYVETPSHFGVGDFTIQFRYYQSATPTPVADGLLKVGGKTVLTMNGAQFKSRSAFFADTPIGQWCEVAITRKDGVLYYYVNGVYYTKVAYTENLSGSVRFIFGNEQQTFKYLDELRILDYAIAYGENYEPTSVPHDTNLSLILPTDKVPVADEYWYFNSEGNILPVYDFTIYRDSADVYVDTGKQDYWVNITPDSNYFDSKWYRFWSADTATWAQYVVSAGYSNSSWLFTNHTSTVFSGWQGVGKWINEPVFVTPVGWVDIYQRDSYVSPYGLKENGTYTFSILLSSGEYKSLTFDMTFDNSSDVFDLVSFDKGGCFGLASSSIPPGSSHREMQKFLVISPPANGSLDIVYMELVEGDKPNSGHEFVESVTVFDETEMRTPTLAVRTDIDITSYQIGGVRPSLPTKGQVWAMVENDRIVSLQVYNGQAWEGVDGRIWTGERWIPMGSYNIITLQDMYDIVDATPNYEYIYSEAGFWAWWQKSWNAFTEKLFLTLGSGGAGGGASGGVGSSELNKVDLDSAPVVSDPEQEDSKSLWQFIILVVDGGKSVVTGTRELFSGVVSTIPDTMDDITGAFDSGGVAVGIFNGSDPDAADLPDTVSDESEVLDPWRYQ